MKELFKLFRNHFHTMEYNAATRKNGINLKLLKYKILQNTHVTD